MSDEPPPPLRLRPRARSEPEAAAAATPVPDSPAPAPAPPAAATEVEGNRLRLKPKLSPTTEQQVQPSPSSAVPEPSASTKTIRLRPAPSADVSSSAPDSSVTAPEPAPGSPTPTRSISPQPVIESQAAPAPAAASTAEPSPVAAAAPPPLSIPEGSTKWLKPKAEPHSAPFPVIAKPSPPSTDESGELESEPAIPHLRARSEREQDVSPRAEPRKQNGVAKPLIGALAVIVIAGGGFFAFRILTNRSHPPSPPPQSAVSTKPPPVAVSPTIKPGPTPSETLNALAAAPAQAIAKAKNVIAVAERRTMSEDRINALEGNTPKVKQSGPSTAMPRPISAHTATKPAPPPVTSSSQLAPGVSANTVVNVAGEASPEFRSWVANAKISGLFQGTPPRALINGHMVRGGQMADEALEITFERIDTDSKMMVFRDKNGATVSRKF